MKFKVHKLKFAEEPLKYLLVSRPVIWLGHYIAVIFGLFVAGHFHWFDNSNIIYFIIFGPILSLFIYGVNDVYDQKSDLINPRKKGIWGLKTLQLTPKKMVLASLVCGLVFIIYSATISTAAFFTVLFFLFLLAFYSIPPLRFKNIPLVDNIIGGGVYSAGIMVTTYLLAGRDYSDLMQNYEPFLVIFLGGFVTQAFGAILDFDADKEAGELTSVTKFGTNIVILYSFALSVISLYLVRSSKTLMFLVIVLIVLEPFFILDVVNKNKFIKMHFPLIYIISALSAVVVITFAGY